MKFSKDLLYDKTNTHLDIARLSALLSVVGYIGGTGYALAVGLWEFDPFSWASGWAALCGGNAAWIFARQRYEAGIAFRPTEQDKRERGDLDYGYSLYNDHESPRFL